MKGGNVRLLVGCYRLEIVVISYIMDLENGKVTGVLMANNYA